MQLIYVGYTVLSIAVKPRAKQQTIKSLIDSRKDRVYHGYVLSVTIIEQTFSWTPSIHLVIEDDNFDCEPMLIYHFPKEQGGYSINKVYTIGSKMHIINPYLRIGANDRKPSIRVDDFSSIIMQNEAEWILNMCRYCGEANMNNLIIVLKNVRLCYININSYVKINE